MAGFASEPAAELAIADFGLSLVEAEARPERLATFRAARLADRVCTLSTSRLAQRVVTFEE